MSVRMVTDPHAVVDTEYIHVELREQDGMVHIRVATNIRVATSNDSSSFSVPGEDLVKALAILGFKAA